MHNLINQAREWAEDGKDIYDPSSRIKVAIDLILSLPDQWVDVEKVREEAGRMDKGAENAMKPGHNEFSRGYAEAMLECAGHLRNLIPTPKLPTLADMTPEERAASQWMQADVKLDTDGATVRRVIAHPGTANMKASVWSPYGGSDFVDTKLVTPLPGEPKLQWPGSEPEDGGTPALSEEEKVAPDQAVAKDVCNSEPNSSETPKSSIKPEDVPPNEPWLIEVDNQEAIGTRYAGYSTLPWAVAVLNGLFVNHYDDRDVTLIHKLVPETHTLPKGMRIADERTLGRVIVTTEFNEDDICEIVYWNKGLKRNCPGFADENDITFLDGNQ